MASLWIAVPAAVVALGAAWMRSRGRASRGGGGAGPVRDDRAGPLEADAGRRMVAESEPEAGSATATAADAPGHDSDHAILERLCAPAFAEAAVAQSVELPAAFAKEAAATPSHAMPSHAMPATQAGAHAAAQAAAQAAAIETLAGIRAHPRYTPRRPHLLPQLTRAINDPESTAQSIAAILAQDPALAGNLLRIANSVVYRRRAAPVDDLERAVTRLGTEGLRQTAMAALLQPVISDDGSVLARCAARLWDHTLLSANLASNASAGASRDDRHAAQLLALLHGLGSVVVVQVVRDAWAKADAGTPDLQTLVPLLDAWSLRCARAISADWGLSERARRTLVALAEGDGEGGAGAYGDPGRLGRTLKLSRALAAASMPGAAREPWPEPEPA